MLGAGGHGRGGARGDHAQVAGRRLGDAVSQARSHTTRGQRLLQVCRGPARRGRARYRVVGIHHHGDVPVGATRIAAQGGGRTGGGEEVWRVKPMESMELIVAGRS